MIVLDHQCSTDISFLLLLLLISMPSNDHQTNKGFLEIDSENSSQFCRSELFRHLMMLENNQQGLSSVVLVLPLIGLQNPSPSVVTLVLQVDLQDFSCCCLNQSQIYLIHEKF